MSTFFDFHLIMTTLELIMFTPINVFGFYVTLESALIFSETVKLAIDALDEFFE